MAEVVVVPNVTKKKKKKKNCQTDRRNIGRCKSPRQNKKFRSSHFGPSKISNAHCSTKTYRNRNILDKIVFSLLRRI